MTTPAFAAWIGLIFIVTLILIAVFDSDDNDPRFP